MFLGYRSRNVSCPLSPHNKVSWNTHLYANDAPCQGKQNTATNYSNPIGQPFPKRLSRQLSPINVTCVHGVYICIDRYIYIHIYIYTVICMPTFANGLKADIKADSGGVQSVGLTYTNTFMANWSLGLNLQYGVSIVLLSQLVTMQPTGMFNTCFLWFCRFCFFLFYSIKKGTNYFYWKTKQILIVIILIMIIPVFVWSESLLR